MLRQLLGLTLIAAVAVCGGVPTTGPSRIAVQSANAQLGTRAVAEQVSSLIEKLRLAADEQREGLNQDVLGVISEVTVSAERLVAQAEAAALGFEEELAQDARQLLTQMKGTLQTLIRDVQAGVAATVQTTAAEATRTLQAAEATFRRAVDGVRPIIAKAEATAGGLIIRTESLVSVAIVQGASALAVVIFLLFIGIVIARASDWKKKWPRLLALLALAGVSGVAFFLALPISDALAAKRKLKDPAEDCKEMHKLGPQLMSAELKGKVPADLATKVKDAAIRCGVFTATPAEASTAEAYVAAALRALGAPLVCRSSAECGQSKVCDVATGNCLKRGVYCDLPSDCSAGKQCDRNQRRCIPTARFRCDDSRPCRGDEICHNNRCTRESAIAGRACNVPEGKGVCSKGRFTRSGSELVCKANKQPQGESCNGLDDNCDGRIDNGIRLSGACTAKGAHGKCRIGRRRCALGRVVCDPGNPGRKEICGNSDDEDCDGLLNNGCPEKTLAMRIPMHCGTLGGGRKVIGQTCPKGYVKGRKSVEGPQTGNLTGKIVWKDYSNKRDCRAVASCKSHNLFKGGNWHYTVTAKPEVVRVP